MTFSNFSYFRPSIQSPCSFEFKGYQHIFGQQSICIRCPTITKQFKTRKQILTITMSDNKIKANNLKLFFFQVRQEPGKVRLGFVPEEWFQFFYKKTGVTGPYTFAITLSTYLVSKEIYVLEHEYYSGLSLLIMWVVGIKKLGPKLAAYLDKEIDVSYILCICILFN